jgi:amidase
MNTTAGSYSLLGSVVLRDAGVVTRLRRAGAVILGKANLSQFSGGRGNVSSGWSARGGQSTSAYYLGGDPCGSSGGSGIAASIGLAAVTLGTETDGSITCPSSYNNLASIKVFTLWRIVLLRGNDCVPQPTLGLTSRAGGKHVLSL